MKILLAGRRLLQSENGAALIYAALVLPVMLGFGALALDYGYTKVKLTALQNAADAAAYSGAVSVAAGFAPPTYGRYSLEALNSAAASGFTAGVTPTINSTATTINGFNCAAYRCVTVTISETRSFLLSRVFKSLIGGSSSSATYQATATAAVLTVNDYCMIVLGYNSATGKNDLPAALYLQGSASITGSICGVAVNSTSSSAVSTTGSAASIDAATNVVGGYAYNGNPRQVTVTYGLPAPDPYASNSSLQAGLNTAAPATAFACVSGSASPGHYTSLNAGCALSPGAYYFDGLNLSGNSVVSGSGVTLIFTPSATPLRMVGNSNISTTAPTSGTFKGVGIASSSANTLNFQGGASYSGGIYWPHGAVALGGNSGTCMQIVANSISLQGSVTIDDSCVPASNRGAQYIIQLIN